MLKYFREWPQVGPLLFTADGTATGKATVSSTIGFYVGQTCIVSAIGYPNKNVQVKRIISSTELQLGPIDNNPNSYTSLSFYTTALSASITAPQQVANVTASNGEIAASVYESPPISAIRAIYVDQLGRPYNTQNPIPVQLSNGSVNIGTVNAELEVQLSHQNNVPNLGDVADSVQIGDGQDILQINSDGSINVNLLNSSNYEIVNNYNNISSVASGSETTVVTFTAPDNTYKLSLVEFSGENIAHYRVKINGSSIASSRTHHGSGLSGSFRFFAANVDGIALSSGDVVILTVLHNRPSAANFEGRIQLVKTT